jgi:hypothetical protein
VWHYADADPEYGRMQAAELAKYLAVENTLFLSLLVAASVVIFCRLLRQVITDNDAAEVNRSDSNHILEIKLKGPFLLLADFYFSALQ